MRITNRVKPKSNTITLDLSVPGAEQLLEIAKNNNCRIIPMKSSNNKVKVIITNKPYKQVAGAVKPFSLGVLKNQKAKRQSCVVTVK